MLTEKQTILFDYIHERLKDQVCEYTNNTKNGNTADFALVRNSDVYELFADQECHAEVRDCDEGHPYAYVLNHVAGDADFEESQWRTSFTDDSCRIKYLDYLLNRSPYADIYMIKDPRFVLEKYSVHDGDCPNNMFLASLVAERYCYECDGYMNVFAKLIEHIPEDAAFFFMHAAPREMYDEDNLYADYYTSDHDIFSKYKLTKQAFYNFRNNNPYYIGDNWLYYGRGSGYVQTTWSGTELDMSKITTHECDIYDSTANLDIVVNIIVDHYNNLGISDKKAA